MTYPHDRYVNQTMQNVIVALLAGAVVAGAALIAFVFLSMATLRAHAHDHTRPDLNDWFSGLHSKRGGLCCDGQEALRLEDPDWDNDSGHYRVRINREWVPVPDDSVIHDPNRFGPALAWPIPDRNSSDGMMHDVQGVIMIRCFMPGAGA